MLILFHSSYEQEKYIHISFAFTQTEGVPSPSQLFVIHSSQLPRPLLLFSVKTNPYKYIVTSAASHVFFLFALQRFVFFRNLKIYT